MVPSLPAPLRDLLGAAACAVLVTTAFAAPVLGAVVSPRPTPTAVPVAAPSAPVVHLAMTVPVPVPVPEFETETAPAVEAETRTDPEVEAETRTDPETETETAGKAETETETAPEIEAETRRLLRAVPVVDARTRSHAERPPTRKRTRRRCATDHDGIDQLEDLRFRIERDVITHYTANLRRLNSLGWSHAFRDKEAGVRGWQIGGFGCRSPLFEGGLRPRDVIQTVNGRKTNTVLQLLGLWTGWKRHDTFDIVVWRRGRQVTLRYEMV